MREKRIREIPTKGQIKSELEGLEYRSSYRYIVYRTVYILLVVAAIAVLVEILWLPVLQISGNSMTPTLSNGEIVFSSKTADFGIGDVVAFRYNNEVLVKRIICGPGDWIDIDEDGTVYVNDTKLDEPYLVEKAFGNCDIELPYQVTDGRYFVMGDHRSTSVDSRSITVGCVSKEQIVGKIFFRIWPLNRMGMFE